MEAAAFFKGGATSPSASEKAAYQVASAGAENVGNFEDLYKVVDTATILRKETDSKKLPKEEGIPKRKPLGS